MKKILIIVALSMTLGSVYAQNDLKAKSGKNKTEKKQLTPEEKAEKIIEELIWLF